MPCVVLVAVHVRGSVAVWIGENGLFHAVLERTDIFRSKCSKAGSTQGI